MRCVTLDMMWGVRISEAARPRVLGSVGPMSLCLKSYFASLKLLFQCGSARRHRDAARSFWVPLYFSLRPHRCDRPCPCIVDIRQVPVALDMLPLYRSISFQCWPTRTVNDGCDDPLGILQSKLGQLNPKKSARGAPQGTIS